MGTEVIVDKTAADAEGGTPAQVDQALFLLFLFSFLDLYLTSEHLQRFDDEFLLIYCFPVVL